MIYTFHTELLLELYLNSDQLALYQIWDPYYMPVSVKNFGYGEK